VTPIIYKPHKNELLNSFKIAKIIKIFILLNLIIIG
jgi:hypothetical protein